MSLDEKTPLVSGQNGQDFDVIIVGAGISGINSAYRVQTQTPGLSYTVLEARESMGGTWDFFRYPGIRSDSDLHTFGFPWRPWHEQRTIADGASIRKYINECAELEGIDKHIQYQHRLIAANWSTKELRWSLTLDTPSGKQVFSAGFVIFASGYYDYINPLPAVIPGLENFKGQVVHPQFWPEDLDYSGKQVVVIGSGATSITLLPAMAEKAAKVTQLQRSPSYIMTLPGVDTLDYWAHKLLPSWIAFQVTRLKFLTLPFIFFKFCRAFPHTAKRIMRRLTIAQLPKNVPWDPHFNPDYFPWEQRLCVVPDGDFYKALKKGKAQIVTGHIKQVREHDILIKEGGSQESVDADIIVTATGLKIQLAGGAHISVDGHEVKPGNKFLWKGVMLQDVPNAAFVIGYTNASWTLGADATGQMCTRLLKHLRKNGYAAAVARVGAEEEKGLAVMPTLNLKSTYVKAASDVLPKAGDKGPWKARSSYFTDMWNAKYGSLQEGLEFIKPHQSNGGAGAPPPYARKQREHRL